jgi:hypothetical protein
LIVDIQLIIVVSVIVAAITLAGVTFARKANGFTTKSDCGADCGCGKVSK